MSIWKRSSFRFDLGELDRPGAAGVLMRTSPFISCLLVDEFGGRGGQRTAPAFSN
jgi:hypothetical protein